MTPNDDTTTSPQWMLHRLAQRTDEVMQRNRDKSPLLNAFARTLLPKAADYARRYADVDLFEREARRLGAIARREVRELASFASGWALPLLPHLVDFDITSLSRSDVATDAILEAERFLESVHHAAERHEEVRPVIPDLTADVEPRIERARRADLAKLDALTDLQERRRALRTSGARFEAELILFRRALRKVLGSTHRDYHYLRAHRARRAAVEAVDNAALEPAPMPVPVPVPLPEPEGV